MDEREFIDFLQDATVNSDSDVIRSTTRMGELVIPALHHAFREEAKHTDSTMSMNALALNIEIVFAALIKCYVNPEQQESIARLIGEAIKNNIIYSCTPTREDIPK